MRIRINKTHTAGFLCLVFFAVSWAGIFSEADGAFFSAAVAVVFPGMCPFLLLMLASVQDLPGLSKNFAYVGFIFVFVVMCFKQYATYRLYQSRNLGVPRDIMSRFGIFPFAGVALIIYAFLTSTFYDAFNIFEQFSDKPFIVVAGMMAIMIISAVMTIGEITISGQKLKAYVVVCAICIFQSLTAGILQLMNGPAFLHSQSGFEANEEATQIMEASVLGFPRITSSYLSPNAFALSVAVLFMIIVALKGNSYKNKTFAIAYLLVGLFVGAITLSKAMIIFFLLTSFILMWKSSKTTLAMVAAVAIAFLAKTHIDWSLINVALRLQGSDLGVRTAAWNLLKKEFGIAEWFFGTGLSYWKSFFLANLGTTLSDPHSFIYSVPGMFGILGVLFYVALAAVVLRQVVFGKGNKPVIASMLFILIFIKDLASTPYVFSNSTVSYMIWICIMSLYVKTIEAPDSRKTIKHVPGRTS